MRREARGIGGSSRFVSGGPGGGRRKTGRSRRHPSIVQGAEPVAGLRRSFSGGRGLRPFVGRGRPVREGWRCRDCRYGARHYHIGRSPGPRTVLGRLRGKGERSRGDFERATGPVDASPGAFGRRPRLGRATEAINRGSGEAALRVWRHVRRRIGRGVLEAPQPSTNTGGRRRKAEHGRARRRGGHHAVGPGRSW